MPSGMRRAVGRWSPKSSIVVVVPSARLRQSIVNELALAGHRAWSTGSIEVMLDLVNTEEIDTVVLHVSAFATTSLSHLAGAIKKRGSVSLIASVSVVSVVEHALEKGHGVRRTDVAAVEEAPRWQTSVYWLPFSRADHLGDGLYGCVLN